MSVSLSTNEVNRIAKYCGEEVRRQYWHYFGPEPEFIAVRTAGMIHAWMDALVSKANGEPITPHLIEDWGAFIEPRKNANGFRNIPIYVGTSQKLDHRLIRRSLEILCNNIDEMEALAAYREFEEIHPFEDGNGRTGKIILNWVNGTLLDPIFPPDNFWGPELINP